MDARAKRSLIWTSPRNELERLVAECHSIAQLLSCLGLSLIGGNASRMKTRLESDKIDFSHFSAKYTRKFRGIFDYDYESMFRENSSCSRHFLKDKIIQHNLIDYRCGECGIGNTWQGERLVLVLDHINGVRNDNRLENLRFLCPNCNSQAPTFAGRNKIILRNLGSAS